eukprot:7729110-Lingulodinium_polyedra.AAC.1
MPPRRQPGRTATLDPPALRPKGERARIRKPPPQRRGRTTGGPPPPGTCPSGACQGGRGRAAEPGPCPSGACRGALRPGALLPWGERASQGEMATD